VTLDQPQHLIKSNALFMPFQMAILKPALGSISVATSELNKIKSRSAHVDSGLGCIHALCVNRSTDIILTPSKGCWLTNANISVVK
jgi:hypothetical protein